MCLTPTSARARLNSWARYSEAFVSGGSLQLPAPLGELLGDTLGQDRGPVCRGVLGTDGERGRAPLIDTPDARSDQPASRPPSSAPFTSAEGAGRAGRCP